MPSNTLQPIQQDPQYVSESLVRGMDFTDQLILTRDTLTGIPSVTASVMSGTDPNPADILVGNPSLSQNNMHVLQRVSNGVPGTAYILTFKCGTTQGNTLVEQAYFYVVAG